jgi:hypothetical protein
VELTESTSVAPARAAAAISAGSKLSMETAKPSATSIRTASPTPPQVSPGSQPTSMRSAPASRSRRASASSAAAGSRGAWLISAMISMSCRP